MNVALNRRSHLLLHTLKSHAFKSTLIAKVHTFKHQKHHLCTKSKNVSYPIILLENYYYWLC